MGKSYRTEDFLKYINTPLNISTVSTLYETNNVNIEYCDLYYDFIISLTNLIFKTYLGDTHTNDVEKRNHFNWCWNKVINNFKDEGINIGENIELYNYFIEFMNEVFYLIPDKNDILEKNVGKLWDYMFNHYIPKSRSDIDTLIEIYKLFELSVKKV